MLTGLVMLLQLQDMTGKSQGERKALLLAHVKGKANDVIYRCVKYSDEKDFYFNHTADRYCVSLLSEMHSIPCLPKRLTRYVQTATEMFNGLYEIARGFHALMEWEIISHYAGDCMLLTHKYH